MTNGRLKPRQQGDVGELSAMEWLAGRGAQLYIPVGHSPNIDLIAVMGIQTLRVEVKTATYVNKRGRWEVTIATRGGNQSWSGLVKYFEPDRCDYLFVHVGDGRRWFIPTHALECRAGLSVGGPKYSEFEIEPGRPLSTHEPSLESGATAGEYPSGQRMAAVNRPAQSFAGSNPASPTPPAPPTSPAPRFHPSKFERKPGKNGYAVINQKRRVTLPQRALVASGLRDGDRVFASADGPGRILIEKAGLPVWAEST